MSIISTTANVINYHQGAPLGSGTTSTTDSLTDAGLVQLFQSVALVKSVADPATVDGIIYLPPNSQIVSVDVDVTTAWDSGTSAAVTVGQTSTGTEYGSSTSVKTTGRKTFTFTATQLANMQNIAAFTAVYFSVAQVGTTTVGVAQAICRYVQKASSGTP